MRIIAFSDWHVQPVSELFYWLEEFEKEIDVIVYGGDATYRFCEKNTLSKNYFQAFAEYSKNGCYITMGNDDPIDDTLFSSSDVQNLHDRIIRIDHRFSILGIARIQKEEKVRSILSENSNKIDKNQKIIILTHVPPKDLLDLSCRYGAENLGYKALKDYLDIDERVKLVICGHCHIQGKKYIIYRDTKVVNVACHDTIGSEAFIAEINIKEDIKIIWHTIGNPFEQVHGLGYKKAKILKEAGFKDVEQFSQASIKEISSLPGFSKVGAKNSILKAKSMLEKQIIQRRRTINYPHPDFTYIIDIETTIDRKNIWAIAILSPNGEYKQWYASTLEKTKAMLKSFFKWLEKEVCLKGRIVLGCWSGKFFDFNVLRDCSTNKQKEILHKVLEIDFGEIFRDYFILPISSYDLKTVSSYLGFQYTSEDVDGFTVGTQWEIKKEEGLSNDLEEKFRAYNIDDVKAVKNILLKTLYSQEYFPELDSTKDNEPSDVFKQIQELYKNNFFTLHSRCKRKTQDKKSGWTTLRFFLQFENIDILYQVKNLLNTLGFNPTRINMKTLKVYYKGKQNYINAIKLFPKSDLSKS